MFGFPSRSMDQAPRFGTRIEQLEDRTVPTLIGTKLYVRDRRNIVALELGN